MPSINAVLRSMYYEAKAARQVKAKPTIPYRKKCQSHYLWFVLYQCAGWTYARIAEQTSAGEDSTIRKGVHKVATEVGVTLRGSSASKTRTKILS